MVEEQKDDGKRLLDRLIEDGVPVAGAGWLKETESGRWYLYVATPLVRVDGGTREAYARITEVTRRISEPLFVGPLDVKVVEPGSPVGRDLIKHCRPGRGAWYGGPQLGDVGIEGAYIYPSLAATVAEAKS